jgi:multiple antibiotic resistance protein
MSLVSAAIVLFLVMDPFGNIPFFLSILKDVPAGRREKTIVRELFIALAVLVLFLFWGPHLLKALELSRSSLQIAGGIILFLIAIRMVFSTPEEIFAGNPKGEPLIVPLAVPSVAGPSAVATVMLLTAQQSGHWLKWLGALASAWFATGVLLLLSMKLYRLLGERVLSALQRFTGLVLTTIAIDMLLEGVLEVFKKGL